MPSHSYAQEVCAGIYEARELRVDEWLIQFLPRVPFAFQVSQYPNRKPAAAVMLVHPGAARNEHLRHVEVFDQPIPSVVMIEPQEVQLDPEMLRKQFRKPI